MDAQTTSGGFYSGLPEQAIGFLHSQCGCIFQGKCNHFNSQTQGDILIRNNDVEITDWAQGRGYLRKQFVIFVTMVSGVDENGKWGERWIQNTQRFDNPSCQAAEHRQYRKHEAPYANKVWF